MINVPLHDVTPDEIAAAGSEFQGLVRMTSLAEAVALCAAFGGEELWMPSPERDRPGSVAGQPWRYTEVRVKLKALLCQASYERLLDECGNTTLYFPFLSKIRRVRRDRMIAETIAAEVDAGGLVVNAMKRVIREHEISRSYVYRIIKRMKAEGSTLGVDAQPEPRKPRTRRLPTISVAASNENGRTYKMGGLAARISSIEAKRPQPSQEEPKA